LCNQRYWQNHEACVVASDIISSDIRILKYQQVTEHLAVW